MQLISNLAVLNQNIKLLIFIQKSELLHGLGLLINRNTHPFHNYLSVFLSFSWMIIETS